MEARVCVGFVVARLGFGRVLVKWWPKIEKGEWRPKLVKRRGGKEGGKRGFGWSLVMGR